MGLRKKKVALVAPEAVPEKEAAVSKPDAVTDQPSVPDQVPKPEEIQDEQPASGNTPLKAKEGFVIGGNTTKILRRKNTPDLEEEGAFVKRMTDLGVLGPDKPEGHFESATSQFYHFGRKEDCPYCSGTKKTRAVRKAARRTAQGAQKPPVDAKPEGKENLGGKQKVEKPTKPAKLRSAKPGTAPKKEKPPLGSTAKGGVVLTVLKRRK
jgi:hypothetical protein